MSQLLSHFLQGMVPTAKTWEQNLIQNWPMIIGPLKKQVRIEKIIGTTVFLGVYDPRWIQELFLLSSLLIDKMNEFLQEEIVTGIKFKHVTHQYSKQAHKNCSRCHVEPVTISLREQKALEKITDQELANALKNFLIRCHSQRQIWNEKKI
jgi:hypothetical protein